MSKLECSIGFWGSLLISNTSTNPYISILFSVTALAYLYLGWKVSE